MKDHNREGTLDQWIQEQIPVDYGEMNIHVGDRVVDLGAHIGHFTFWALEQGAHRVRSFEPDPGNAQILVERAGRRNHGSIEVFQQAVTKDGGKTELYRTLNENTGAHSTVIQGNKRLTILVDSVAFEEVMDWPSNVIKCDVEGAEHEYDWTKVPPTVHDIAMEIHLHRRAWFPDGLGRIMTELASVGFRTVRDPQEGMVMVRDRPWRTIGIWQR